MERNDSLDPNTVRNTSDNKRVARPRRTRDRVLTRNHIALECLHTLAVAFNNSKVYGNSVTGLEIIDVIERFSFDQ